MYMAVTFLSRAIDIDRLNDEIRLGDLCPIMGSVPITLLED